MKTSLPKIKKLIEQSLEMGDTGHILLDKYCRYQANLTGHPDPYYKLFYLVAQELNPKFVVELGSYRAGAAGHFAVGDPMTKVLTMDVHGDMPQQQPDKDHCLMLADAIRNLIFIQKCSIDNMPKKNSTELFECAIEDVKKVGLPIDILFIDATHDEKYVKREWELYEPLLADEALVICDDIHDNGGYFPGMEAWWASFKYQKFVNNEVHPGTPMGFIKYKREKPNAKPKKTSRKTSAKQKKTQGARQGNDKAKDNEGLQVGQPAGN